MMENNNLVSIVIPVYNAECYLEETAGSLVSQSYSEWEVLWIDDGSTDKSPELLDALASKEPRFRVFHIENSGAALARNRGVSEAEGRYLAFLDADDLWEPDKLEKELEYLKEKDAAFVYTGYEFADERGAGTGKVVEVPETLTYKQALKNTTIFTSTVLFDMEKTGKERLFMPQIKSEDTALWWRLLREGYTAWGLNENLVKYRRAGKSLSSNKLEAVRRIWNLYRKAEKLSVPYSIYNFIFWAFRAVARRI